MMIKHCMAIAITSFLIAGCGDAGPNVVSVTGTVTLDDEPLANKSLLFTPIDGTEGHGAGGSSDASGKYTLTAVVPGATRDYAGVLPGSYRVTVFEPTFSEQIGTDDSADEPVAAIAPELNGGKSSIPRIYSSEQSPLVIEVPEVGGTIDIPLTSQQGR